MRVGFNVVETVFPDGLTSGADVREVSRLLLVLVPAEGTSAGV